MPATHHSATESLGKAWRWVPGLYAAGEIPSSMIIYVSLLMFLQLDCGSALSTCYSSLLFLPSVLLPLCRHFLLRTARVRIQFYGVQLALLASLVWLASTFPHGRVGLWLPLLAVSALSVWHRMLADALLEQQMDARSRQFLARPVLLARQASLVLTYGVLIILVGGLQVITRQPLTAWSKGLFIMTGMVLLLFAGVLSTHRFPATRFHATPPLPFSFPWRTGALLLVLLLPQSLMFHARVLMLLAGYNQGGLACTIQEVGFAQGTVGVLAFCLGDAVSRWLPLHRESARLHTAMMLSMGLSPAVYLLMTVYPPSGLLTLCMATFTAQLCFGLGLGACRTLLPHLSSPMPTSAAGMLQVPAIAACMILPMACSGWMVEHMGYHHFFLLATLLAPLSWLATKWAGRIRQTARIQS